MLRLVFENGETRCFDMKPWSSRKPFHVLTDPELFSKASVKLGTVRWPNGIDMAPDTLYDASCSIQ